MCFGQWYKHLLCINLSLCVQYAMLSEWDLYNWNTRRYESWRSQVILREVEKAILTMQTTEGFTKAENWRSQRTGLYLHWNQVHRKHSKGPYLFLDLEKKDCIMPGNYDYLFDRIGRVDIATYLLEHIIMPVLSYTMGCLKLDAGSLLEGKRLSTPYGVDV